MTKKDKLKKKDQTQEERVFRNMEEVRRTFYPKAREQMTRRRHEGGLEQFRAIAQQ